MSEDPPATKTGFDTHAWWFLLGMLVFGIFGLVMYFASAFTMTTIGLIVMAVLMAGVTAGLALWAFRRRRIDLGSGLLVGYALAAVASGGQCTFLATSRDYGFLNGLFVYVLAIAGACVIAVIASFVSMFMSMRGGNG